MLVSGDFIQTMSIFFNLAHLLTQQSIQRGFNPKTSVKAALATTLAMLSAGIVGCQPETSILPKNTSTNTDNRSEDVALMEQVTGQVDKTKTTKGDATAKAVSQEESAALPSMSRYTLERSSNQSSNSSLETSVAAASNLDKGLEPGEYCFYKTGNENWLSIRLHVDDNQQLKGESAGSVNHPQQGELVYQQVFAGELMGDRAMVNVTTYIADTSQSRKESWIVNPNELDMGRVAIEEATCSDLPPSL